MEKKFKVLSFNEPDSQGDIFLPGSIKHKERIPILMNFDVSKAIGFASVQQDEKGVTVTANLKENVSGLYPGICFQVVKQELREDGVRVLHEIKLLGVGVGSNINVDENIKPIE